MSNSEVAVGGASWPGSLVLWSECACGESLGLRYLRRPDSGSRATGALASSVRGLARRRAPGGREAGERQGHESGLAGPTLARGRRKLAWPGPLGGLRCLRDPLRRCARASRPAGKDAGPPASAHVRFRCLGRPHLARARATGTVGPVPAVSLTSPAAPGSGEYAAWTASRR